MTAMPENKCLSSNRVGGVVCPYDVFEFARSTGRVSGS